MKKLSRITEGILGDIARRDLTGNKKKEDIIKPIYFPETYAELLDVIEEVCPYKAHTIQKLDLRTIDVSKVDSFCILFNGRYDAMTIDISTWDTSNITDMSGMFIDCNNLECIKFGKKWKTDMVFDMNGMFKHCEKLKFLDTNDWNTMSLINTNRMFENCKNLSVIGIEYWDTTRLETSKNMFENCKTKYEYNGHKFVKI